jgi:hypothetical protein
MLGIAAIAAGFVMLLVGIALAPIGESRTIQASRDSSLDDLETLCLTCVQQIADSRTHPPQGLEDVL